MKIRIKKQHLENSYYMSNRDCPMARALKGLGYKKVWVGGYSAEAFKNGKKFIFNLLPGFNSDKVYRAQQANNKPFTATIIKQLYDKNKD